MADGPDLGFCPRELSANTSVLYENRDGTVLVLDIPRSLEEAQTLPGETTMRRRIVSSTPLTEPFELPEPSYPLPGSQNPAAALTDLFVAATVTNALRHLQDEYHGPFLLPRVVLSEDGKSDDGGLGLHLESGESPSIHIPPQTQYLNGSIQETKQSFLNSVPKFDVIILDPPWPNRSARRKKQSYATAANLMEVKDLLLEIPIVSHLKVGGLVFIWTTNKASILELMQSRDGILRSWGLELTAEWTWLKITTSGEPIFDIESSWRKPWERLLVVKRVGDPTPPGLRNRTICAVPDIHSRKPNLRGLMDDLYGKPTRGLEIFARNLTAGWWSWGDQVLHFQEGRHWRMADGGNK